MRSEIERIEMEKTQDFAEETEKFKSELTEKVDLYLDYVVKEWMQENELAIDRGLKGEIAEDFITGLKHSLKNITLMFQMRSTISLRVNLKRLKNLRVNSMKQSKR